MGKRLAFSCELGIGQQFFLLAYHLGVELRLPGEVGCLRTVTPPVRGRTWSHGRGTLGDPGAVLPLGRAATARANRTCIEGLLVRASCIFLSASTKFWNQKET